MVFHALFLISSLSRGSAFGPALIYSHYRPKRRNKTRKIHETGPHWVKGHLNGGSGIVNPGDTQARFTRCVATHNTQRGGPQTVEISHQTRNTSQPNASDIENFFYPFQDKDLHIHAASEIRHFSHRTCIFAQL
jgi:hypothetical protein